MSLETHYISFCPMGHCFSCFKTQSNDIHQPAAPVKKDEVTGNTQGSAVNSLLHSEFQQVDPLLGDNHQINGNKRCSSNNYIYSNSHISPVDQSLNLESMHNIKNSSQNEKVAKTFYQKLPSLSMPVSLYESKVSEAKINQLFDQYKDSTEDAILAEGIENFCNDLQLNPDEFKVLVLAWKLNAEQMCRFSRNEFVQGLKTLKTDSIKGIQTKLIEMTNELQRDSEQFKELYRFTFKFGLDVSIGQRILPCDVAILLWRLVFTYNQPPILSRWLNYLESNSNVRGIPKDTWYMFLNFSDYIGDDLSSYDDTEAWPSLFDDFVEYENDQMNQNISKSDIKV